MNGTKKINRFKFFNFVNQIYLPCITVTRPPMIKNIAANQAYMYINAGINTIMIAIIIPSTNIAPPLI